MTAHGWHVGVTYCVAGGGGKPREKKLKIAGRWCTSAAGDGL